jgi:RHS repeat-associated protein
VIFRNSYTGQEFDSESGLFNYGGRPYDPFAGKFIQEDKIGFAGGDTNLSRYVFNSPTNLVDPDGYIAASVIGGTVVTGLVIGGILILGDLLRNQRNSDSFNAPPNLFPHPPNGQIFVPPPTLTSPRPEPSRQFLPPHKEPKINFPTHTGHPKPRQEKYVPGGFDLDSGIRDILGCLGGLINFSKTESGDIPQLQIGDKQIGKKLGSHVSDFGGNPKNPADRDRVRKTIEEIGNNPDQVVPGTFSGQGVDGTRGDVDFRIKGNDVVVTKPDGTFVTILKNGITNTSVKNALEKIK